MNGADLLLAGGSVLLAAQSAYASALMLYAWQDEEKHSAARASLPFAPPRLRFSVILPARHEEAVIQDTIQRIVDLNYPPALVEALVVIDDSDTGTIAKAEEKLAALRRRGIGHVHLLTYAGPPINKPRGLNVGLGAATGDVVAIFDAEDEPHPDILNVVNTAMQEPGTPAVQAGVQLMNYADRWYSALNVLEYFFWYKSRLHYYAVGGVVPLGGNTVFIRRDVLERVGGWDVRCLTEDADMGVRLGAAGVPVKVLYDDRYVTQEETPPTVEQFIRQRTRWDQGYLQVLAKGDWLRLPTLRQRALAAYTLSFPLLQALLLLYVPISLWLMVFGKVPSLVALLSSLPLYMLLLQLAIGVVGLYEFAAAHQLRPSFLSPLRLLLVYIPYQWLLSFAALRAVWRLLLGINTWEKTTHTGALRRQGALVRPAGAIAMADVVAMVEVEEGIHG